MFLLLILSLCFSDVWGVEVKESEEQQHKSVNFVYDDCGTMLEAGSEVMCNGKSFFVMGDSESLLYGFGYAPERGGSAQDILLDIKQERLNILGTKVYRGREVDCYRREVFETMHFSVMQEYILSSQGARAFLKQYKLEGAFMCVGLEDLGDFGIFLAKEFCKERIQIGLPPKAHPVQKPCKSTYGYDTCFTRYKKRKGPQKNRPIVFCSSGSTDFRGAGEFLFQLDRNNLQGTKVSFFFTALSELSYIHARENIVNAARVVASREGFEDNQKYWNDVFDKCVQHVGCQKVRKSRVVFAQDAGNVLAPHWTPDVIQTFKNKKGPWDVLVGAPSEITGVVMALYFAQAYSFFNNLSGLLKIGCITGKENADKMPDRSQHTLLCVGGPEFPFMKDFGEVVREKFQYKDVDFVQCDLACVNTRRKCSLISGGSVDPESFGTTPYFDVLFLAESLRVLRPLEGYEGGLVMNGRVYAKIQDPFSREKGFEYARERGGTAQEILAKIEQDKKDFSSEKVFCCLYEKENLSKLGAIKFLSTWYEKTLSECAVDLFVRITHLKDIFLCIGFEDTADFCDIGQFLQGGTVHVSTPKRSDLSKEPRFDACLDHYKGQPIVFCASGRNGFAPAGEFLYALQKKRDICEQKPDIYFCMTILAQKDFQSGEVCRMIMDDARNFDSSGSDKVSENLATLEKCVKKVFAVDAYNGQVVFAQDRENLLVSLKPESADLERHHGTYDVLVGWLPNHGKDAMAVAYWQSAYGLFEQMREYGAACITGEEGTSPSKEDRTLLCVNSVLFEGAEAFGNSVACKLNYKGTHFVSCDDRVVAHSRKLVAHGCVGVPNRPTGLISWLI